MSEILEENSDIQKEEQPNVEAGESSTNLSQGTEPTPAPAGPPPMPERWHGTSFPKAYSLGFSNMDLEFEEGDVPTYADQSYITEEMRRSVPKIPAVAPRNNSSTGMRSDMGSVNSSAVSIPESEEEQRIFYNTPAVYEGSVPPSGDTTTPASGFSEEQIPSKPVEEPPLPPVFDISDDEEGNEGIQNQSIDQIIGLAPEKQLSSTQVIMQKVQSSMGAVKDITTQAINRMFRRSSTEDADLLGINQEGNDTHNSDKGSMPSSSDRQSSVQQSGGEGIPRSGSPIPDPSSTFNNQPGFDYIHVDSTAPCSNDDVAELFGVVSLDDDVGEDSESDPEDCQERSGKQVFDVKSVEVCLQVLQMSKQITPGEALVLEGAAQEDRKNVERILRSYMEDGMTVELYNLLRRKNDALPANELKLKVLKNSQGDRYEIQHLQAVTLSVPKIFVFQDTFFYLAELRHGKINLFNKWSPCVVQILKHQIRIFKSLSDIAPENTMMRINLHSLMTLGRVMKKPYKHCMYYYIKLFENDLTNHRVIEDKPDRFRRDLNSIQTLKIGSKEEMVLRAIAYQISLRLKDLQKKE